MNHMKRHLIDDSFLLLTIVLLSACASRPPPPYIISASSYEPVQPLAKPAELRGIDFRAVGNEPGWSLEIDNDGNILFINNYGEDPHVFATPDPVINQQAGTAIYLIQDDEHTMTIVLRDQQCYDDMSGEPFDTAVTLIFDGRRFKGCGKALR